MCTETRNRIRRQNDEGILGGGRGAARVLVEPNSVQCVSFGFARRNVEKVQEGGIVVGRRKVWSITYADDIILVATSESGMNEMLKKVQKYIAKEKLTINTDKTKIMLFEKGGRQKKVEEGEEIGRMEEMKKKMRVTREGMKKIKK